MCFASERGKEKREGFSSERLAQRPTFSPILHPPPATALRKLNYSWDITSAYIFQDNAFRSHKVLIKGGAVRARALLRRRTRPLFLRLHFAVNSLWYTVRPNSFLLSFTEPHPRRPRASYPGQREKRRRQVYRDPGVRLFQPQLRK